LFNIILLFNYFVGVAAKSTLSGCCTLLKPKKRCRIVRKEFYPPV
jgi:hypothetical protein